MSQLVIPPDGPPDLPPDGGETVTLVSDSSGNNRYRIERSLDSGGMGDIFVAVDTELNREVVVKKPKGDGVGSEEARQQFLREIRVGALLEHPGVVPVYDIGRSPDGGLFGVMRLFDAGSLHKLVKNYHAAHPSSIDEVAFRKLLGHFATACRAIDHAHSRGVYHLDVKPKNIVTGRYGETQVIDWGLAWIKGDEFRQQVEEASGSLSGSGSERRSGMAQPHGLTRSYAPPEQHARRWDAIGPRSDVYALGATLHEILASEPPFNSGSPTLREDIEGGHLHTRPKPWAPRALVAIARKAMAVAPANRYASAADLADDVDRFLADEPVSAFPDPPSVRAWRFVKRHRAAVSAAGALLLTSSIALGVGYVAVSKKHQETLAAKADADKQRDRALKAKAEADEQRDRAIKAEAVAVEQRDRAVEAEADARTQEQLARDNAAATRGVIAGFIDSVADNEWAKIPGTAELRLDAVRKVLDEYPKLIEQQPDDPDLRFDASILDRSCANLFRVLGKLGDAKPLYDRSRERLDALVVGHPANGRYFLGRAELLADVGEMQLRTGGPETALPTYGEAVKDAAAGHEKLSESMKGLRTLARVRVDHADALGEAGDMKAAAELARQAVKDFDGVIAGDDGEDDKFKVETRLLRAFAAAIAARLNADAGDGETALAMARDADRRSGELSAVYGGNPNVDYVRSTALLELGRIRSREPATQAEGEAATTEALGMLRALVAGDGDVANFRPALAETLSDRAEALLDAGDDIRAVRLADEAIAVVTPLIPIDRSDDAFEATRHLARANAVRGRAGKSHEHLLEADRLYAAVGPAAPRNEKLHEEAAQVKELLAE